MSTGVPGIVPEPVDAAGVRLPAPPPARWDVRDSDPGDASGLASALSLPLTLCRVLAARGIQRPEEAKSFLRPRISDLPSPQRLTDAERAAGRIAEAIRAGEGIFVHGDYDVDGIAGAALLSRWIRRLGGSVTPFVPHRIRDGYDFGTAGVEAARASEAGLVVTADCGIVAHDAVERVSASGVDVIVTDHHTPGDRLPDAFAVVNPNRSDCDYPEPSLSGTGVVFKLVQLLGEWFGVDPEETVRSLDLVALATVADLVPLTGENRVLVRYGLRALEQTRIPGLRALIDATRLGDRELEAGQVGFVLAPPINAAGRVGDARTGLELLLTDDEAEAARLAGELVRLNRERREEDRRTLGEVEAWLESGFDPDTDWGVVVDGEGWHPGVIGIVASRVVERIHRPAIVVTWDGDQGRGSARSIPGFDLYAAIHRCGHLLGRYGGHKQAAGMDVARGRIEEFRAAFNEAARSALSPDDLRPVHRVDIEVRLGDLDETLHRMLRYTGPFGIGNPRPSFVSEGLELEEPPRVVRDRHLKLRLAQDGVSFDAIGFGLAERRPPGSLGLGPIDAVYQLRDNEYRGRRSLQLRLIDVRPSVSGS